MKELNVREMRAVIGPYAPTFPIGFVSTHHAMT